MPVSWQGGTPPGTGGGWASRASEFGFEERPAGFPAGRSFVCRRLGVGSRGCGGPGRECWAGLVVDGPGCGAVGSGCVGRVGSGTGGLGGPGLWSLALCSSGACGRPERRWEPGLGCRAGSAAGLVVGRHLRVVDNLVAAARFCRWGPVAWFEGAGGHTLYCGLSPSAPPSLRGRSPLRQRRRTGGRGLPVQRVRQRSFPQRRSVWAP